jgi:NAD(P)-dependent dehydrogenase (short-subunit alcohol dehydrogenase family)
MSQSWLHQKAIVIIGGTSGIGLSAAQAFVTHGATVVVVGRDDEHAEAAQEKLGTAGIVVRGDASGIGTAENAIEVCLSTFKFFHGLYHVAGGSGRNL